MATKKAASTKKATAKKPAAAKTTVRTVRADAKPATTKTVATKAVAVPAPASGSKVQLPSNIVNIVLAELFGTFILTLVALAATQDANALYVGIALALLVVGLGAISGTHINPAVTFGLWTMRKLKTVLVPFYWGAQFLGAMLAVIVSNWVANSSISLSFSSFAQFDWSVFGVELVATAVFLFGLAAVISRRELGAGARALGIGASLAVGLVVGGTLLTALKAQDVATYQKQYQANQGSAEKSNNPEIPHSAFVKSVTANPAVALAVTDNAESALDSSSSNSKTNSRLTLEVIAGTLVGAAVGGNLYLLIAGRRKND